MTAIRVADVDQVARCQRDALHGEMIGQVMHGRRAPLMST